MQDYRIEDLLFQSLANLGDSYPLRLYFNNDGVNEDLSKFQNHWTRHQTQNAESKLYEFNLGKSDKEFYPSEEFVNSPSLYEPLKRFIPHLTHSYILEINEGGFLPFQTSFHEQNEHTFCLIALLKNCSHSNFCLIHNDKRLFLDVGKLYFLNSKIERALFSFINEARILLLNVKVNEASIELIQEFLESR